MLSANEVTFSIHTAELLHAVTLSIAVGKITAILGANGAGKSTLLKTMAGDLKPSSGTVSLHEKPLSSYCPRSLARQRAVLPQHSTLQFGFQVLDVVEMGRAPHLEREAPWRNREIALDTLDLVGCTHLKDREYTSLSGGEQQRVHLARVLAQIWEQDEHADRFLLLDEPTSSLDLHHQIQVFQILTAIAKCGVGIGIVVHDLNLAAQFADHVLILKQGKALIEGHPRAVMHPEIIESAFSIRTELHFRPGSDRPYLLPIPKPFLFSTIR